MNQRKRLFAANWKMNKTVAEATSYIEELVSGGLPVQAELVIAASFPLLPGLKAAIGQAPIWLAAQNMFCEEQGAFTGEVSPLQLVDLGVTHVIIGHSERRQLFGETDELIHKKLVAAETYGLIPIFCVGETLEQRRAGQATATVQAQISSGISGLQPTTIQQMVVAYEPIWAIGTGETATPAQAEEMHSVIHQGVPAETRVIYGGSVKPDNSAALIAEPSIDGFLVGGASLETASFRQIFTTKPA